MNKKEKINKLLANKKKNKRKQKEYKKELKKIEKAYNLADYKVPIKFIKSNKKCQKALRGDNS